MIESIQSALSTHGIPSDRISAGAADFADSLAVPLQTDREYRDHVLVIQTFSDQTAKTATVSMTLVLPFYLHEPSVVPEVARTIFLLNRFLPIGHFGLNESPLSIYFRHRFLASEADVQWSVVESVLMVAHFCNTHSQILEQVIESTVGYDDVADQLKELGLFVPSVIATSA